MASVTAPASILTVTTVDNDNATLGQLSLKQALTQAAAGDTIKFNIPGVGPHVIVTPDDGYPFVTVDNLTIDGYSQPGSSANTNPILAANNAKLDIVLDSSTGTGGRTLLGPLNNPGFGDSESGIIAILGAKNFKARGLCFRSRQTGSSDSDPDIYCFAFVNDATGAQISGCWFGVDPDGTTLHPGRASVANFKGDNGTTASGLVIGTNGDGVDDRAEFNVHEAMGLAIHLETPNVRVSGNFINVLPDGKTILPIDQVGEAIENGAGAGMLIGTDGDGISDSDERNIIGSVQYDVIAEFWRAGATNMVFAGNYVGVNVDGSAMADSMPTSLLDLRKQSNVRIGTNGDGVSDDVEENWIASLGAGTFIHWNGSNRDSLGVDAAKIVARANRMENDAFAAIPLDDGNPVGYPVYYANYIDGSVDLTEFAPALTLNGANLTGTFPASTVDYPFQIIDFYTVDQTALANGIIHPLHRIASLVDNSDKDGDPAIGKFSIPISAFNFTATQQVTAAVTYSKDIKTEGSNAVTGPLALQVDVGPSPDITVSVTGQTAGTITLSWTGGSGKFLVQKKVDIGAATWFDVLSTSDRTATVAKDAQAGFYRVQGSYTGPDVIPLTAFLSGDAEKPTAVTTTATGVGTFSVTDTKLNYLVTYQGLGSNPTASHIHSPADSLGTANPSLIFNTPVGRDGYITGTLNVDAATRADVLSGKGYVNIHTASNGGGEIRGQVMRTTYTAALNGANERPTPITTAAIGAATITIFGKELKYQLDWTGLSGTATAAHIHGRATQADAAPAPVIQGFSTPSGASGTLTGTAQVNQATLGAIADGMAYVNIHTAANGGGEIRGQLTGQ